MISWMSRWSAAHANSWDYAYSHGNFLNNYMHSFFWCSQFWQAGPYFLGIESDTREMRAYIFWWCCVSDWCCLGTTSLRKQSCPGVWKIVIRNFMFQQTSVLTTETKWGHIKNFTALLQMTCNVPGEHHSCFCCCKLLRIMFENSRSYIPCQQHPLGNLVISWKITQETECMSQLLFSVMNLTSNNNSFSIYAW